MGFEALRHHDQNRLNTLKNLLASKAGVFGRNRHHPSAWFGE